MFKVKQWFKVFAFSFALLLVGCAGSAQSDTATGQATIALDSGEANTALLAGAGSDPSDVIKASSAWLDAYADGCPTEAFPMVTADPANGAYPAPTLNAYCQGGYLIVESNGIPTFAFDPVTPAGLQAQNYRWQIPLVPTVAAAPSSVPLVGPIGLTITGLPIYGPTEAPQDGSKDPYLDGILDYCGGHTHQGGVYHFHVRPDCLFLSMDGNPALIVGFAFDGYPILAPFLCLNDDCTEIVKAQSSWKLVNPNVEAAWQQHAYVEGSGNLDQCNGATLPDGTYAYFATDTFPYFLGCYRGVPHQSNQAGGGQPGGGGGGPVQPPPPGSGPGGQPGGGPGQPPPPGGGGPGGPP